MNLKKIIKKYLNEHKILNENVDFNSFPSNIRKTLENEYGHYYLYNFDWNTKQDEFIGNRKGFNDWLENNPKEEFSKNLNKIIQKVRQDLITLIKEKNAKKALDKFEELIIPVLGNSVLCDPLSEFMERALLNLHSSKEIENAFKEAENIIDADGSLNIDKIRPSKIFTGGGINEPKFEKFAKDNPEYLGVFNDWKRLFDISISSFDLNSFRNSVSYNDIRELYDFLIEYRKSLTK